MKRIKTILGDSDYHLWHKKPWISILSRFAATLCRSQMQILQLNPEEAIDHTIGLDPTQTNAFPKSTDMRTRLNTVFSVCCQIPRALPLSFPPSLFPSHPLSQCPLLAQHSPCICIWIWWLSFLRATTVLRWSAFAPHARLCARASKEVA